MKRTRPLLLAGTLVATLVVGGVGYWLVARQSPEAAFSRVWLDVGLLVFLTALIVGVTQSPAKQVQKLVETLRGISIGQRDRRLEPEQFGDLAEVARATNEIAAALTEHEDPALGQVQRRRRTADEAAQKQELEASLASGDQPVLSAGRDDVGAAAAGAVPPWRQEQLQELSAHPEVGPVRKRKKPEAEAPASASDAAAGASAEDDARQASSEEEAEAVAPLHDAATVTPVEDVARSTQVDEVVDDDTNVDTPSEPSEADREGGAEEASAGSDEAQEEGGPEEAGPPDSPTVPDMPAEGRSEPSGSIPPGGEGSLEALFEAYLSAKVEHGEATDDLELHAFVETIRDESERLKESHQCRDVRFEVRVQDGQVSLLPRLLR